jgi:phosphonate transport system substrate-binding protein
MPGKVTTFIAVLGALVLLLACQSPGKEDPGSAAAPTALSSSSSHRAIIVGDIESDEPVKKLERFQPLADYLAAQLHEFGVTEGRVVLARDVEEMARFIKDGKVDVFFDSAFPTLAVQKLTGSQLILRGWKQSSPEYWSTYVVLRSSGIESVKGLAGGTVAFEEPNSTSGFILPAGTLIQRGFNLREINGPGAPVADDEIGYFFSRDEENTIELVLSGQVAGGGISNQDYEELPAELQQQLVTLGQTITVPRQLVSIRPGLEPELVNQIRDLLIGLEQTDEGEQILTRLKKTTRFDALPLDSEAALGELERLIKLVSGE